MTHLILALVMAGIAYAMSRRVSTTIISALSTFLVSYLCLPTLSWGFAGILVLLLIVGLIGLGMEALMENNGSGQGRFGGSLIVVIIGVILLFILPMITTWSLFHASSYHALLGTPKERVYATDTAPLDPNQARIVDQEVAKRLGDKKLGEQPALGSQVNLGEMNIQQVNGQLFWVAPLDHSGFFKWWSNSKGTPGYVMVSANNESDVRLVQNLEGKPLYLRYNQGNFFNNDIHRYVYSHGYATKGLTDFSFEIDDSGRPFWVITVFEKRIGFSGNDAVGVVTLDAQNGELEFHSIDDAPLWIDRIQPEDLVFSQIDDWGQYVNGWWNPSNLEKLSPTPGMSLVFGNDGQCYWYTGISSVGSDEGTVGFMLINTRNKEVRYYHQSGATETAAMESARGAVQEKGYQASFPILYNVSGLPTYFVTLKDDAGLVKMMAFVSVESYQIVGVGDNIQAALREYRRAISGRGNMVALDDVVSHRQIRSTIRRMGMDVGESSLYYNLVLTGFENKLFVGSSNISVELSVSQIGDSVSISFDDGGNAMVDMVNFDNLDLAFQTTEASIELEERHQDVRDAARERRDEINLDSGWEDLSIEQKQELMRQQKSSDK